jgi:hypothetical protein
MNWPDFFVGAIFATLTAGFLIRAICLKQVRKVQRVADFNFELAELNALENQVLLKQLEALERNRENQ